MTPSGIYLFEDVHHLVFDGSSGRILEKDVRRAVEGGEPEKENVSLFELAATEEAWLQTGEAEEALAYWKELLAGCEPGCSTSAFFTAAFGMLLSAFTGKEDVLFNTIAAGRDETTANTVGMLVRTLPVRMNLKEQGEVDEFLRQVQAEVFGTRIFCLEGDLTDPESLKALDGLDAVILRAGNLMGRYTDGEFQINFETNAFMRSLWAYVKLRKCPFSILERPVEFSPIDSVAEAVLKLAEVDGRFSVFHMNNNHTLTITDLMDAFRRYGFDVQTVPDSEFRDTLSEAAKDGAESRTVLSLVAYSKKEGDTLQMVDSDRRFTINALFRLGFRWPIVDDGYLEKMIWALDSLSFFTDPQ